jgi:hypothetical protein
MADDRNIIDGYKVIQSVSIGGVEIVVAENSDADQQFMTWRRSLDKPFGAEEFMIPVFGNDYLDIFREFIRVQSGCLDSMGLEKLYSGGLDSVFSARDCTPDGMKTDITGKIVALKPDVLEPEFRNAHRQLVLCTGGFGTKPNARGRAVYCTELYSGEQTRWNRGDILGVVAEKALPGWVHDKLAALQHPKEMSVDQHEFKLVFPVSVTLFHGVPGEEDIEPYFTSDISSQYVEALNKAMLEHPVTNAAGRGLVERFSCADEAVEDYVQNKISCALPAIVEVNGELYGMVTYTVNSATQLSGAVKDALREALEHQLAHGWGQAEFEASVADGVLRYDNGRRRLESQHDTQSTADDDVLKNAVLNVRVNPDMIFVSTLEELRERQRKSIAPEKAERATDTDSLIAKESVIAKIRDAKANSPTQPQSKKYDKSGPEL